MKFVGVSTPAWTIIGDKKQQQEKEDVTPFYEAVKAKEFVLTRAPVTKFGHMNRFRSETKLPKHVPPPPVDPKEARFQKHLSEKKLAKKQVSKKPEMEKIRVSTVPGPGSYNDKTSIGEVPRFSFGYKQDPDAAVFVNPQGPGAYHPMYIHKEPSKGVIFPKAQNDGLQLVKEWCAPGPGKYVIPQPRENTSSRKGTFARAGRDDFYKSTYTCSQGPIYDVNQHTLEERVKKMKERSANRPSHKEENKIVSENSTPGPGLYNITFNGNKANAPKWGFGSSNRPPLNRCDPLVPGPGMYPDESKQKERKDPKAHTMDKFFGLSKRHPLNFGQENPGPGTYFKHMISPEDMDQETLLKTAHGPKFSFKGRKEVTGLKDDFKSPGPGEYEFGHLYTAGFKGPFHAIGTSQRPVENLKVYKPGPGEYEVRGDIDLNTGIKFPKSKRKGPSSGVDPDVEIGPGYYDLKSTVPQLQPHEAAKMQRNEGLKLNLD